MSSTQPPGFSARMASKWDEVKPIAFGLIIGLIAGPIISGYAGFQVRTSAAQTAARGAIVELQADICSFAAHREVPTTSSLGWQAQNDLARKHAAMPGSDAVDPEVVYACAGKLSR
jgi:hypothetical protein